MYETSGDRTRALLDSYISELMAQDPSFEVQDYSQEGTDIPSFGFENKYAQEQGGPIANSFEIGPGAVPIDDVPVRGDYRLPSVETQVRNVNGLRKSFGLGPITIKQYMRGV